MARKPDQQPRSDNRPAQQQQHQQQYSSNEAMTLQQRLEFVLGQIARREEELTAVLPPDINFKTFHATINQALRNNPKILACTGVSIVNACVKSAYDGLRLDGKEAALVDHKVNIAGKNQPPKLENHAEYFPMVRGLIKKILIGGKVVAMEVETIHRFDEYDVVLGTNPAIHHRPKIDGDRGPAVAYYSVALLAGGERTAQFMTKADVDDVRKEAKTKFVWDRWPDEMGKKSVVRRHEKRLPSGRDFRDIEAQAMFPQFDKTVPHPQLAQARPVRGGAMALEHQADNGVPMDFGNQAQDREPVTVDQEQREDARDQVNEQRQKPLAVDIPADGAEWSMWEAALDKEIAAAPNGDAVNAAWKRERGILDAATRTIRDRVISKFTDRIAELATDGAAGAGTDGDDDDIPAGEQR